MKAISFLWFPPTLQTERHRERPWLGVVTCLLESASGRDQINEFEGEGEIIGDLSLLSVVVK